MRGQTTRYLGPLRFLPNPSENSRRILPKVGHGNDDESDYEVFREMLSRSDGPLQALVGLPSRVPCRFSVNRSFDLVS